MIDDSVILVSFFSYYDSIVAFSFSSLVYCIQDLTKN